MKVTNCSIVIPVYRSANSLPQLLDRLAASLPAVFQKFEVILINDGSPDNSWQVINELQKKYAWLSGINLMRNFGQHNAVFCGIMEAQYEFILTMDDDLQHPPEELHKMAAELEKGFDVVYGIPMKEQHGAPRDFASVVIKSILATFMGAKVARNVGALRIFRSELRKGFEHYQGPYVNMDVLLSWTTTNFGAVPVHIEPRKIGTSTYNFKKLLRHALNLITGFSTIPLQIASILGFSLTIFGIGLLIYVLVRFLMTGGAVQGFTFLASVISIFSGAQLFSLGIIGEYLARMYFRLMDKPKYVVRERTRFQIKERI
jgi:glycosyltransferase involved in cell wall biosynthesis